MTKVLYLVRHAQASESYSTDLYRPLNANGMIDATRMATHLSDKLTGIQAIIASNSERTRMTAEIFVEKLKLPVDILRLDETLYESTPRHYLALINSLPESVEKVMIVGHNPSISYLCEFLCKTEFGTIPTAGVVGLSFEDQKWTEVAKRTGKELFYDSPDSILGIKLD